MSEAPWEPTPEAIEQAGKEITKRFSAFIRALGYAQDDLAREAKEHPEDAVMASLEDLDMFDLRTAVICALRGVPIPAREDLPELEDVGISDEEWRDTTGWMLGEFPDNDPGTL